MKTALVLAAGRGARLDRIGTPKPLVDVGGQPMLLRLIEQFELLGIETVHVVLGYERQHLAQVLTAHHFSGISLVLHDNRQWESGMAFSVLAARERIREPFVLSMADHVFDLPLLRQALATPVKEAGVVALIDDRLDQISNLASALKVVVTGDRIARIGWAIDVPDAVDAGLFLATPVLFAAAEKALAQNPKADLAEALQLLAREKALFHVRAKDGAWDDIDTPSDLVRAEARLRMARRTGRVKTLEPPPIAPTPSRDFAYNICQETSTRIAVKRGIVANPAAIDDLVPLSSASSPVFVFSDETVNKLYGRSFVEKLEARGYLVHPIVVPDGEEAKTLFNYAYVVERVLSRGVDERSVFISLGGGVVCNVCGFVASTIYRGLDLVHLPTSLMAQCDAAISHKQAINGYRGKNMVGTYYAPRLVAVDVEVLGTMSDRQIRDGLAEVIKHGLGQDASLAKILLDYDGHFRDLDFLETVITRNIELKCLLVRDDPKEKHAGMVLQYGHTVGHPIEHLSGYTLSHGESVGIGMLIAAKVSKMLGAGGDDIIALHERLLEKYGLPTRVPRNILTADMLSALKYNKKYLVEGTRMALIKAIGSMWDVDGDFAIPVSEAMLAEAFESTREP